MSTAKQQILIYTSVSVACRDMLNDYTFRWIFYSSCRIRHKKEGNKDKRELEKESLKHEKRLAREKMWEAHSESEPLLHSHSQSDKEDTGDMSGHVISDTSSDY